jgi:hypothetical protein
MHYRAFAYDVLVHVDLLFCLGEVTVSAGEHGQPLKGDFDYIRIILN